MSPPCINIKCLKIKGMVRAVFVEPITRVNGEIIVLGLLVLKFPGWKSNSENFNY